ncbi:CGNR zinc finger domain-containing protein [Saccharomonospora piscinae]|uniref:CGNR zinc finger domain-containing protein n=1 Tax=Saccharomonospora piscinae TaxID=687388 RepID=UPI001106A5E8|nr:CGNR zinc finger domain-containing protein [Saccharomonospora piscinae]TLW92265.1 CGNR zinc finger domain-containing protein [Saccharomonospora piscinae]
MPFSRTDAPGELGKLEGLCNSARLLYTEDALITSASASAWLRAHEIEVAELNRKEHDLLLRLRETVRDHLDGHERTTELNRLAKVLLAPPRWSARGEPVLPPKKTGALDTYLADCLALVFTTGLTGELDRLKVCQNPDCRWVFYDRSPAQNSIWCSMDVCGARHKMRTYRSRHAR